MIGLASLDVDLRLATMGLYQRFVYPRLVDLVMRHGDFTVLRSEVVPLASGAVLEVGVGSGLNIPLYSANVTRLYGVDPSLELLEMAERAAARVPFPVRLLAEPAEHVPLEPESVDTVVTTWTLCTVREPLAALREMRRVLKPDGRLLFVEHGWSPDPGVHRWQRRLTPVWKRIAGGCHLDRKIDELIAAAGFGPVEVRTSYLPGPRPFTHTFVGSAGRQTVSNLSPGTSPGSPPSKVSQT